MNSFKVKNSFDKRLAESDKITSKYMDRVPVIIEKSKKCTLKDIDKKKFLVPHDLTMGQFLYVIRKRLKLIETDTIFLFINDSVLPLSSESVYNVYLNNKDEDGFLYLTYCNENTFGSK